MNSAVALSAWTTTTQRGVAMSLKGLPDLVVHELPWPTQSGSSRILGILPPFHSIAIISPTISVIGETTPCCVMAFTTAGLPLSIARLIAGPRSFASSTRSP